MREVQLRDAKSGLSKLVDDAVAGTPSAITRHGRPTAVVVGIEEWRRLNAAVPSFAEFLLTAPFEDGDLPARRPGDERQIDL